jgi:hypothetical protein
MSKSVESKLAETEAQKVALEAQVTKLAGENDTYTKRMKDMEDSIQRAMDKMKEMEAKIGDYAVQKAKLDDKMETTAKSLAEINIVNEGDKEDEDEDEENEEGDDEENEGEEETKAENSIEGVNPKVVTGQPLPKKLKGKGKAKMKAKATTESAPEVTGNPEVNEKFDEEKKKEQMNAKAKAKAEEIVAEPVAEAPVVEKQAEVVAPAPVAQETVESRILSIVEKSTAELGAKFANTTAKFNELDAELAKAKETLAYEAKVKAEANATVQALTAKYEALLAKVSGIETNTKSVEEKVAKTVASLGVEPVASMPNEMEAVAQASAPKTAQELLKEWESIADAKASRAFYVKHQDAIISATFPKKK